jgi:hypothetical protein
MFNIFIKILINLDMEINVNIRKANHKKLIANIIFNGEKVKAFPLIFGIRQDIHFHHLYSVEC